MSVPFALKTAFGIYRYASRLDCIEGHAITRIMGFTLATFAHVFRDPTTQLVRNRVLIKLAGVLLTTIIIFQAILGTGG
jgi:hypothetical protein